MKLKQSWSLGILAKWALNIASLTLKESMNQMWGQADKGRPWKRLSCSRITLSKIRMDGRSDWDSLCSSPLWWEFFLGLFQMWNGHLLCKRGFFYFCVCVCVCVCVSGLHRCWCRAVSPCALPPRLPWGVWEAASAAGGSPVTAGHHSERKGSVPKDQSELATKPV